MTRYVASDDAILCAIRSALFIGSLERKQKDHIVTQQVTESLTDWITESHMDLAHRMVPWFTANSASYKALVEKEVPDWVTHFWGPTSYDNQGDMEKIPE